MTEDAPMPRLHALRRARFAGAVLLLGAAVAGCSSDGLFDRAGSSAADGSATVSGPPLRMPTVVTRVLGELSEAERRQVAIGAKEVITGYVEAAYLHQRPGSGYRGSFPGFTKGARALALQDTGIVADRSFDGAQVRPRDAVAYVSVVAPEGRPVGATARVSVDLVLDASERTRRVTVSGRLLLTPRADRWRIFGYDLSLAPTKIERHHR
jgi:hypothetical protein